jgi:uroporphyrinogen decarboxylase
VKSPNGVMTERARVEALLNHQTPDRVPVWPFMPNGFAVRYSGLSIVDAYTNPEGLYQALRKTARDFGWVFVPQMGYAAVGAWEFGGEVRMPTGEYDQAPVVTRHPLEKDEDIYNLKWPGPDSGFNPTVRRFGEIARQERLDNEPFNIFIGAGNAYNLACQIVGLEKFLKWLLRKPDLAHELIDRLSERNLALLPAQSEKLGTEGVLGMGGSPLTSNQLISVKQFQEFALPDIKKGQALLRELGYKTTYAHICGEQNDNLPYWAEVDFGDPGIIGVGPEISLEYAAECFPDDIIIGNVDPAIIQTAGPQEVYDTVGEAVETGKKIKGGYIFSPGCDLPPMAPVENVRMMTKAVNDFGWY